MYDLLWEKEFRENLERQYVLSQLQSTKQTLIEVFKPKGRQDEK